MEMLSSTKTKRLLVGHGHGYLTHHRYITLIVPWNTIKSAILKVFSRSFNVLLSGLESKRQCVAKYTKMSEATTGHALSFGNVKESLQLQKEDLAILCTFVTTYAAAIIEQPCIRSTKEAKTVPIRLCNYFRLMNKLLVSYVSLLATDRIMYFNSFYT